MGGTGRVATQPWTNGCSLLSATSMLCVEHIDLCWVWSRSDTGMVREAKKGCVVLLLYASVLSRE